MRALEILSGSLFVAVLIFGLPWAAEIIRLFLEN